jgi:ferric-dicitrate binding protein FerR (iron transport regulator)
MSKFEESSNMTCEEVQLLVVPMWANMSGIADKEKEAFNAHILVCSACAEEYEETKELMSLVKAHWGTISDDTQKLLEDNRYEVGDKKQVSLPRTHKMTVEEGWQNLLRRCPGLAEAAERGRQLRWIKRISAIAACLIVGILAYLAFSVYPKTAVESVQVVSSPISSVKIELLSNNTKTLIPSNQPIISADGLKTLLINNKHQMVLNVGTSLSIEPLTTNSNLGCLVKLNSGEIYTHVEHDGNPFVVQTANGKAIITGTTFNVKAEGNNTTLIVSEGNVQLKSRKGEVSVGAGQLSQIVNQSAPKKPVVCDTDKLTAWAKDSKPILVQVKSNNDNSWQLPLSSLKPEPINLDSTNYKFWVEEKRDWFSKNFPWIFELKNALAKEGIEADYPELLIKSNDVWQFMCLNKARIPARFSLPDCDSLLKTVIFYDFDKEWLLKNIPSAKVALGQTPLMQSALTGPKAFDQWLKYAKEEEKAPPPYYYSADACKYLVETRSLIWFAVRNGKLDLTDIQRVEVLDLLQQEVTAACDCQNNILYLASEQKTSYCRDECQINCIVNSIKKIEQTEKNIWVIRNENKNK